MNSQESEKHSAPGADQLPSRASDDRKVEPGASNSPINRLSRPSRSGYLARVIVVLIIGFVVWSNFARLDEVAIAEGEVVPKGEVKIIQHLEGGIIRNIHVQEGTRVERGAALVSLDLGTAGLNPIRLRVKFDSLLLARARLAAHANDTSLKFDEQVARRQPLIARNERNTFNERRREFKSTILVLRRQIQQREHAAREVAAKRKTTSDDLKLSRRALAMSASLLSRGLTAKLEHIERQRLVRRLVGNLSILAAEGPKIAAALQEARERLREERYKFRRIAYEELTKLEVSIASTKELLAKATEQKQRAEITSPIDGIVKNLRYHTIGGVVRPGEALMEIVPTKGTLVIQARLSPTDRGYVRIGQSAVVKISSYEFVRYGGLDGKVIHIAADTSNTRTGQPYYRVVVKTEKTHLGSDATPLPITPGMQATVDIHTGSRSVLRYIMRPVLKLQDQAFRER